MAHLDPTAVRLCLGALPQREQEILRHLCQCAACREMLAPDFEPESEGPVEPDDLYQAAFERVGHDFEARLEAHAQAWKKSVRLLDRILEAPPERWSEILGDQVVSPTFLTLLLEWGGMTRNSDLAERIAQFAPAVLDRIPPDGLPPTFPQDSLVRAWSLLGRIRSEREDWLGADEAFDRASGLISELLDPLTEATYCRDVGESFLRRRRRIEAAALLARATQLFHQVRDYEGEVATLCIQAFVDLEAGDGPNATSLFSKALGCARSSGMFFSEVQIRLFIEKGLSSLDGDDQPDERVHFELEDQPLNCLLATAISALGSSDCAQAEPSLRFVLATALRFHQFGLAMIAAVNLVGLYLYLGLEEELSQLSDILNLLADRIPSRNSRDVLLRLGKEVLQGSSHSLRFTLLSALFEIDRGPHARKPAI